LKSHAQGQGQNTGFTGGCIFYCDQSALPSAFVISGPDESLKPSYLCAKQPFDEIRKPTCQNFSKPDRNIAFL